MIAATYLRISDDRAGRGLGVTRQRQDTRRMAESIGAHDIREYRDNDRSASNGKPRPEYLRLMADITTGALGPGDVVVAYNQDRLCREPAELEDLMRLCRKTGVGLRTTTGEINVATADGRTHARLLGVIAKGESEKMAERISRAMDQRARQGKPHGRTAYGWSREVTNDPKSGARIDSRDVVNATEAAVVREIADRLLAGETVRGIRNDLTARGVPSPTGKGWYTHTIRHLVTRPRNIGKRIHQGVPAFDGEWEPILDVDTWNRVCALLRDPARRTSRGNQPKHLLSGIAVCGVCRTPLRATGRDGGNYRDSHVQRNRDAVDVHVTELVETWLDSDEARGLLAGLSDDETRAAVAEAEALDARLAAAADDYADGLIDRAQMVRITSRLRPQIDAARARASAVTDRPVWVDEIGRGAAFSSLPLDRRRAIIRALFVVEIVPVAVRGRHGFDRESVRVTPRRDA